MQKLSLGDVCVFAKGFGGFKASTYKDIGIPILRVANIDNFEINEKNLVYIDSKDYSQNLNKYLLKKDDLIIAKDASIGKLGKINIDRKFLFNSHILKIDPIPSKINRDYLYHFLISKSKEIENLKLGVILPSLDVDRLKKIKINLPDLATQALIATKLNKFWKLSEELHEELNLRKKQYEHYRDELLAFKQDNKIEWLTLKEIVNNNYGGSFFPKDSIQENGYPCIRYVQLYEENRLHFDYCTLFTDKSKIQSPKYCEYGDILITRTSRNIEGIAKVCAYLGKEKALIDNICVVIKHNQNPKYLAYALSTANAQKQKEKLSMSSGLFNITFDSIKKIKIPLPSLEKQEEIVNLLDKFWSLSNSINEGLPAEILLRKQQYKYYRESLLNQINN